MLAKTPIEQRFYNWVNSQPTDQFYLWTDTCHCACGRFLREEMGLTEQETIHEHRAADFPASYTSNNLEAFSVWEQFDVIARGDDHEDWTFGKLAKRIREKV
jgi:hypothetical protein